MDSPYTDTGSEFVFTSAGAAGNVERMIDNGETLTVSGWACRIGGNGGEKIGVGVSGGNLLNTTYANISREKEVKDACQSESYSHGFSFTISKNQRNANDGKTHYDGVDGISLSSASAFTITKAKDPIEVEHIYIGYLDSVTLSTQLNPYSGKF